jgi:hypothetical protein
MHIAVRNDLDEEQSRILLSACDMAWRRVNQTVMLTPMQQVYTRSAVRAHLVNMVRQGERNEHRLASRAYF